MEISEIEKTDIADCSIMRCSICGMPFSDDPMGQWSMDFHMMNVHHFGPWLN